MPPKKLTQKKLGSLSSFQPTLSFKKVSSKDAQSSVGATASTASASSSSRPSRSKNSGDMPPPPVPPSKVPSRSARSSSQSSLPERKATTKGKGKEKAPAPSLVIEIDDDEEEVICVSSDEEVVRPQKRRLETNGTTTRAMWTDVYAPTTEAELAPGKGRITKLKEWLIEAVHGVTPAAGDRVPSDAARERLRKYRRILMINGPAGIGKTTTVRIIAEQLGIELVEWTESVEERSLGDSHENETVIAKLLAFLARHAYPPLSMGPSTSSQAARSCPRVLLMTSLPNLSHLPTRDAFHTALLAFCKAFNASSCPLVIVHSDAGSGGRAEESWMDRERGGHEGPLEILGREVKDGPWCTEISFLPLAITFLTKALNRVINLAIEDPKQRPVPGAVQLIAHSANGDLRSAINSLQVLCTGSSLKKMSKRSKVTTTAKASGRGSRGGRGAKVDVSDDIRAALDSVTRREQSLNLFHALGKVLYNKRLGDPPGEQDDQETLDAIRRLPPDAPLPRHLKEFTRRKSLIQMEEFIPTIPVDASTFALWIHHNVHSFCNGIDELAAILDDFGAADLMRTDDDIWQSSPQAIAYALHMTVRGTLMGLPSPVERRSQKVVKPQFFDSFRLERENGGLVDTASEYLSKQAIAASVAFADGEVLDGPAWGGISSHNVLATETVPMALKIQRLSRRAVLPPSIAPLALQAQSGLFFGGDELGVDDEAGEDSFDVDVAGEDGMGVPDVRRWEYDDTANPEQISSAAAAAAVGWLADDDIEDWDD